MLARAVRHDENCSSSTPLDCHKLGVTATPLVKQRERQVGLETVGVAHVEVGVRGGREARVLQQRVVFFFPSQRFRRKVRACFPSHAEYQILENPRARLVAIRYDF